ncbi:hypothetical protein CDAR_112381 [Caerostris darwini]|uniref:Uncharacterized protein n=1 Tax=Caerostris darwini TaxID=1538125 RepID=A0AAV4PYV9_9ARAC|nr:hypothetical protein CDAR_112381 [Caerostris darwini]
MSQSCMKCSHQEKPVEDSVIHKDRMARSRCIDGLLVEGFIPQESPLNNSLHQRDKAEKLTVVIRVPAYEAEVGNFLQLSISNCYFLPLKFPVTLALPPTSQQTLWKVAYAKTLSHV